MSVLISSVTVIAAVAILLGAVVLFCECACAWFEVQK